MATAPLFSQAVPSLGTADFLASAAPHEDTVYVYNFWATWCKPCVAELPHFQQLQADFADQPLKVVLLSLDFEQNWETAIPRMLALRKVDLPVIYLHDAHDDNAWIDGVGGPDWYGEIPASLLIHRGAEVREFAAQEFTYEALREWVQPVIEKAVSSSER